MTYSVSRNDLCAYLVHYHSLDSFDNLSGENGVRGIFNRIGSVQYDPLNVVGSNPNLVLQSRIKGYNSRILDKLLYKDRFLIDGWDKEMSIYKTEDWRYFKRIRVSKNETYKRMLEWRGQTDVLSYTKQILKELKTRGPLGARDIDIGKCKSNRWGHKKIAGAALDYLFSIGKVGIYERKNAIRVYDLTENLLPSDILKAKEPFGNRREFYKWYFLRRIGSIGIHWLRNGLGWNGHFINDSKTRKEIFKILEKKGSIVKLTVPQINDEFYIRQQDFDLLQKKPEYDNHIRILAPLDNMLWDRLMVYKLFRFKYTWEVYVPAEKRKYGYYVLPVLYQNKLIARMEPVKQETGMPFSIKNWWWEDGISANSKMKSAIKNGIKVFSEYLKADGIDKDSLGNIY